MTSTILKLIALITMIIDHTGAIFFPGNITLRIIGRIAFPIYCFLLIEGYNHTKNIQKYGLRLFIFALISEIPFDYAFYGGLGFSHQNIFFTLTLGLLFVYMMDQVMAKKPFLAISGMILSVFLAEFLRTDYGILGIIYIVIFYIASKIQGFMKPVFTFIMLYIFSATLSFGIQYYAILAVPFIALYNGKKGSSGAIMKYGFYIAYPLHLTILYFIKILL